MPFGHGKPFLSGNTVLDKIFGGWQVNGIDRNQSGTPSQLTAGRAGMNGSDTGVVLENMTTAQLQSMMADHQNHRLQWHRPGLVAAAVAAISHAGLHLRHQLSGRV